LSLAVKTGGREALFVKHLSGEEFD